MNFDVVKSYF